MKTIQKIALCLWALIIVDNLFLACVGPGPEGEPPVGAFKVKMFYKTSAGADLLNPQTQNSFKEKDLKVILKQEANGVVKEVSLDDSGIQVGWDNDARLYYFGMYVPTKWGNRNPIESYVHLSPSLVDTVTYTFFNKRSPAFPDSIFYNKKMVWLDSNVKPNSNYPPIIIVK
jgi:hypothetical protein